MNSLFMGDVEYQVHKDWERRFNKRVVRRSEKPGISLPEPVQTLVDNLKRAF